ncbi:CPBP family glutamic-type intramembrane protease [Shewanella xiamenensis]|uniref:CPBP family glutamic-type intramembrane protease n=1 Tax=Shewanella TaxID=22 RepID=UPI00193CDB91|nr:MULTISPECIES: CPBP family glutamic-type intramembrane protease [Shewanella]MDL3984414.1 CPBP family glutamic-type intramembrane protease [Shewanella xiamenensis]MDN5499225.1 CPBP family glutamic-type intramembrane protease [Shewanella sp.]MDN5527022.1 CPBP family glutamic-type intramembrane protease [Shewanella sp.]QRK80349.1 CPBP family intramembrane metalloprotease [Shewanella sp. LZH-2]
MDVKAFRLGKILFCTGFLGVISIIPFVSTLLESHSAQLEIPISLLILLMVMQSSFMLVLMIFFGVIFSQKVGLFAPVFEVCAEGGNIYHALKPQFIPALIGGVLGGLFLLCFMAVVVGNLPQDFIQAGESLTPPWYAKVIYGGITEEILIRWGLMSFITWCCYRLTQAKETEVKPYNYVFAIVLSAFLFGIGHLPVAFTLTSEVNSALIFYIIFGNAGFGIVAGYLYWKRGLECAMLAHIIAHLIIISFQ